MAADTQSQIVAMLAEGRPELQAAAALVLGELGAKAPAVVQGLCEAIQSEHESVRIAAIEALERLASPKALPALLDALAGSASTSQAAARAIAALGDAAIHDLQARLHGAPPWAAARINEVLAQVAGKKGLSALLDGFIGQDKESVIKSSLLFRHELKTVEPKEKKALYPQVTRFLESKKAAASDEATLGALRILGYLEDERALDTLLEFAKSKRASMVRCEALIALRFALGSRRDAPEVAGLLVKLLGDPDKAVARTALDTLGNLEPPPSAIPAIERLALGDDAELAATATVRLGLLGPKAAPSLVRVVLAAPEARGQQALAALGESEDARAALLDAVLNAKSDAECARLSRLLQPHARRLAKPAVASLSRAARARLKKSMTAAEPLLALLGLADPAELATLLREEAAKAPAERARELYAALLKSDRAKDDDRLALARLELARSNLDLGSRGNDPALELFSTLARRGVPVADDLAADKALTPEHRFYVGFHLSEIVGLSREIGHEVLVEVSKGRGKLAKQAKAKLKTTGYEE
ncbi:MAG: HEAT repeat domain-containing protein [Myxococcales bacterium]